MYLLLALSIVVVLIVVLRLYNYERFKTLQKIVEDTDVSPREVLNKAHTMLDYNEIPIGSVSMDNDSKILKEFVEGEILNQDKNKSLLVESNDVNVNVAGTSQEFKTRVQNQDHRIFTQSTKNLMTLRNLKHELVKLAKEMTPIPMLKRRYVMTDKNNVEPTPIPTTTEITPPTTSVSTPAWWAAYPTQ